MTHPHQKKTIKYKIYRFSGNWAKGRQRHLVTEPKTGQHWQAKKLIQISFNKFFKIKKIRP